MERRLPATRESVTTKRRIGPAAGRRPVPALRVAPAGARAGSLAAQRAFTLVELLVAIVVIGILVTLVVTYAARARHQQKIANTHATMNATHMALGMFETETPLRMHYDGKIKTFGPYPPYQLAGDITVDHSVARLLDSQRPGPAATSTKGDPGGTLADRLARDMGMPVSGSSVAEWVRIDTTPSDATRSDDDNRALSAYLTVFTPGAMNQIPSGALKPLKPVGTGLGEYVNVAGKASIDPNSNRQVLGIFDAFDVPLDYFLYVHLAVAPSPSGTTVKIVDRQPVLRSRGIERDVHVSYVNGMKKSDPGKWEFSKAMPSPYADVNASGVFNLGSGMAGAGWVRAVGSGVFETIKREDYGYVPQQDP
jgi:prepilin-type N-terminal cleavage/methylation domain-containing protein